MKNPFKRILNKPKKKPSDADAAIESEISGEEEEEEEIQNIEIERQPRTSSRAASQLGHISLVEEDTLSIGTEKSSESSVSAKRIKIEASIDDAFRARIQNNSCTVPGCKQKFNSLKISNIKRHFERTHKELYEQINSEFAIKGGQQTTLEQHFQKGTTSSNRNFALFVATSTFSLNLVENNYWKKFVASNPHFKYVNRKQLSDAIGNELSILLTKMNNDALLNNCSISLDIATTKGMLFSYLGLVLHYWSENRNKCITYAADLIELDRAHTAGNLSEIVKTALTKIGIKTVVRVVTDSASNMKAAFTQFSLAEREIESESELDSNIEEPDENQLIFLDQVEKGTQMDELEEIGLADEFNWSNFSHFACSVHRLQLVLKDAIEKDKSAQELKKRIFTTINKFAHSHDATKNLMEIGKKKLLFPSNTRWNTLSITYSRVVELFEHINTIAIRKNWPHIEISDLELMKELCALMEPFMKFSEKLQSNEGTISLLLPGIQNLISFIESLISNTSNEAIQTIGNKLIESLKRRFSDVLEIGSKKSDPIFIAASILDPNVAYLMVEYKNASLSAIKTMYEKTMPFDETTEATISAPALEEAEMSFESPFGFGIINKPAMPATSSSSHQIEKERSIEDEFSQYFLTIGVARKSNLFEYWHDKRMLFPKLAKLAFSILPCPASSAAVERLFSQLTLHSVGHKSNTKSALLKKKVLLSFNKMYID